MGFQEVSGPDEWASLCSRTFVPLSVSAADPQFRAGLEHVALTDRVGITRVMSTGSRVVRSPAQIRLEPRDTFLVAVHGSGVGSVAQNGRQVRMGPSQATIYDTEVPYTLGFPGLMSETVLQVPRAALDPRAVRAGDLTARLIDGRNPALSALSSLMQSVLSQAAQDGERQADGDLLADAALNLVRTAIALESGDWHEEAADANRVALRARVGRFVDQHLADPQLTPDALAGAHHVSLRHLQVVLAEVGDSPSDLIRSRRLDVARQQLMNGCSVLDAAYRSGFSDPGTFTRAFRRSTGETPSTFRARYTH